jgi:hypothetical protein
MRARLILLAALAAAPAAFARQPSGDGDPAAKSCMRVESDTGHLGGEVVCKTNADWAALKAAGIELDQFGYPLPPKDSRDVANHGCTQTSSAAINKDGTRPLNFQCH